MQIYVITISSPDGKPLQQEVHLSRQVAFELYRRCVARYGEMFVHLNSTVLTFGPALAVLHEVVEQTRMFGVGMAVGVVRKLLTIGAVCSAKGL